MNSIRSSVTAVFSCAAFCTLVFGFATQAHAYAGLGPMIPMIGSGIALIFMFAVTLLGAVLYPIRMAFRKFFKKNKVSKNVPKK